MSNLELMQKRINLLKDKVKKCNVMSMEEIHFYKLFSSIINKNI